MEDKSGAPSDHPDLISIFATLEAEYRIYRRAVERYHNTIDKGFRLVRHVLAPAANTRHGKTEGLPETDGTGNPLSRLTNRETQILRLIASGSSTKQAASVLGIKFKTAVGHRSQLMKKLAIHDTASLVRLAIRSGLIDA